MISILIAVVAGLLILGVLVFVHELGHFAAAKAFGVRVLTFSLGFGAPLIRKIVNGTEYRIGSIPLGGYVHMAGEHPEDASKHAPDEFTSKPIWQRAVIAIAGPGANIVFSILALWVMFLFGEHRSTYLDNTVVGAVADSSLSQRAGLLPGDILVSMNAKKVSTWDEVAAMFMRQDERYVVLFSRNATVDSVVIVPPRISGAAIPTNMTAGLSPAFPPIIGVVNGGSPAAHAGLLPGDSICSINNLPIVSWFQISQIVGRFDSSAQTMPLTIERNGIFITVQLRPLFDSAEKRYIVGIKAADAVFRVVQVGPVEAVSKALQKTWEYTTMIFDTVGKLVSRKVSAQQLSGPIGIVQMSGAAASAGIVPLLSFTALIGINLAILNLLPLIITDGGMLLFLFLEAIRRKPLSKKSQLLINRIAIAFFMALFLYVTFNDIIRAPQMFQMFGK